MTVNLKDKDPLSLYEPSVLQKCRSWDKPCPFLTIRDQNDYDNMLKYRDEANKFLEMCDSLNMLGLKLHFDDILRLEEEYQILKTNFTNNTNFYYKTIEENLKQQELLISELTSEMLTLFEIRRKINYTQYSLKKVERRIDSYNNR